MEAAWFHEHCADGQAEQWVEPPLALPVFRLYPAALSIRLRIKQGEGLGQVRQQLLAAVFPVFALEQDDEIVAPDVPDKIIRPASFGQQASGLLDNS